MLMCLKQILALLLCLAMAAVLCAPGIFAAETDFACALSDGSDPCGASELAHSSCSTLDNSSTSSLPAESVCSEAISSYPADSESSVSSAASASEVPASSSSSDASLAASSIPESASHSDLLAESLAPSVAANENWEALFQDLMQAQTLRESNARISGQDTDAFLAWVKEQGRLEQLTAHLDCLLQTEMRRFSATVTNAGPLLPPVDVRPSGQRSLSADLIDAQKTAQPNDDGSVTLRLETYATSAIQEDLSLCPVDIVVVLDQSGSMTHDFNDTPNVPETESRQYALKQAVITFIQDVAAKYSTETDHRLCLVTFDYGAQILQGWTEMTASGSARFIAQVNRFPVSPNGPTNTADAMDLAVQLMGSDYYYQGPNPIRQKVVILLTDGSPTTDNQFSVDVADRTLAFGNTLKQQGVTLYSMGIFTGANPAQLYGDSGYDWVSDGSVGSIWATTQTWWGGMANCDIPAGNRFLNYLSSNYQNAPNLGARNFYDGQHNPPAYGWQITNNFARTATAGKEYYLTAHDLLGLANIFTQISSQIASPDTLMNGRCEIRDVMTPYFTLPKPSDVQLFTADSIDGTAFAPAVPLQDSSVTVSVDPATRTLSVTGFDLGHNFVSEVPRVEDGQQHFFGRKLIVEFKVWPRPGFLGGNNVPTNQGSSGVYLPDSTEHPDKAAVLYPIPQVNLPIPTLTLTVPDAYTYLGTDSRDLHTSLIHAYRLRCGNQNIDLSKADDPAHPYGLEPWQTAFVTIEADAAGFPAEHILTKHTPYAASAVVRPKEAPNALSQGPAASAMQQTAQGQLYLLSPIITWKDSWMDLRQTADYPLNNFVSVQWMFQGKTPEQLLREGALLLGDAGILDYQYTPSAAAFLQDTPVAVRVYLAGMDLTNYVEFRHQDCNVPNCKWGTPGFGPEDCQFIVHIRTVDLTIEKKGESAFGPGEHFVFTIDGPALDTPLQAVIQGEGNAVITGLAPGPYTITETNWSWRYEPLPPQQIQLDQSGCVVFTNKPTAEHWLSGEALCENLWNGDLVHRANAQSRFAQKEG